MTALLQFARGFGSVGAVAFRSEVCLGHTETHFRSLPSFEEGGSQRPLGLQLPRLSSAPAVNASYSRRELHQLWHAPFNQRQRQNPLNGVF